MSWYSDLPVSNLSHCGFTSFARVAEETNSHQVKEFEFCAFTVQPIIDERLDAFLPEMIKAVIVANFALGVSDIGKPYTPYSKSIKAWKAAL